MTDREMLKAVLKAMEVADSAPVGQRMDWSVCRRQLEEHLKRAPDEVGEKR